MKSYDFIFYRDTEQASGDWHDTLEVICGSRMPVQKQVMLDAYGKARTVNEPGSRARNAAAAAAAHDRMLSENVRKLVCRLVSFATEFALYGNIWQQWITYMLMTHENAFTLSCERRSVSRSSTMMKLAEKDFELFRELMNCDLKELGRETGTDLLDMFRNYRMPFAQEGDSKAGRQIRLLCSRLNRSADAIEFGRIVTDYYAEYGAGIYGLYRAFRVSDDDDSMRIVPVIDTEDVTFDDLVGYEEQKQVLKNNTEAFISGISANNVLLYGDSGTGKSTSVHALMHDYYARGLRLIEIGKQHRRFLPQVMAEVKKRNYKFIIFLDDLSFEENESDYKELKGMLEGALESREDSVLIYATSNRRHLIRETWGDRNDMEHHEDIHRSDTMEEKLSLAARFGVTVYYAKPDQADYIDIVKTLAERRGLSFSEAELEDEARKWELRHGGMTGRAASQLVAWLEGKQNYN